MKHDEHDGITLAMRPKAAARALGVSERVLWSWTADKTSKIPFFRRGGCLLYPTRELADWLAQQVRGAAK